MWILCSRALIGFPPMAACEAAPPGPVQAIVPVLADAPPPALEAANGIAVAPLVLHPNNDDPLIALQPMPSAEEVPEACQKAYDIFLKNRDHELSMPRDENHTLKGERIRAGMHNMGDKELVQRVSALCDSYSQVGHPYDLRRDLLNAGREDLLEYHGPIQKGADVLDDHVRQKMKAEPHRLRGRDFTHTEVKQNFKSLEILSESVLRNTEESNVLEEVRRYEAELMQKANILDQRAVSTWARIKELEKEAVQAEHEASEHRAEGAKVLGFVSRLQEGHVPVKRSRMKRGRSTVLGLITQPHKRAAAREEGKTAPGTQRDAGVYEAMQFGPNSTIHEVQHRRVYDGFMHAAKGNRLAQQLAAVNTLATGAVLPNHSAWETCDDAALDAIIAGAQAAKEKRAAEAAARAAEAAAEATTAEAATAEEDLVPPAALHP